MAFGATYTLTFNAVNYNLNRINQDNYGCEYLLRTSTDEYRLKVRHSTEKPKAGASTLLRGVDRHNVEITHTVFATASTPEVVRQAYAVYRVSPGDTVAVPTLTQFIDGANAAFGANTLEADLLAWAS